MENKIIDRVIDLFKAIDAAAERGEDLCIYTPLHSLMWESTIGYSYFDSYAFCSIREEFSNFLFSSTPIKIVKLNLSYHTKNAKKIIVKVTKDPNDTFDLGLLLYQRVLYGSRVGKSVEEEIKEVAHYLNPGLPFNENVFYLRASNTLIDAYHGKYATPTALMTSQLFMSGLPIYLKYEDALKNTLRNALKIFGGTIKRVNQQIPKFIMPVSNRKTVIFNGFVTIKSPLERLIFRNVLMKKSKTLKKVFEDYKKKYAEITAEGASLENLDIENLFDYKAWNDAIKNISQFAFFRKSKDRLKYFNIEAPAT